jgi:hypothetical protein
LSAIKLDDLPRAIFLRKDSKGRDISVARLTACAKRASAEEAVFLQLKQEKAVNAFALLTKLVSRNDATESATSATESEPSAAENNQDSCLKSFKSIKAEHQWGDNTPHRKMSEVGTLMWVSDASVLVLDHTQISSRARDPSAAVTISQSKKIKESKKSRAAAATLSSSSTQAASSSSLSSSKVRAAVNDGMPEEFVAATLKFARAMGTVFAAELFDNGEEAVLKKLLQLVQFLCATITEHHGGPTITLSAESGDKKPGKNTFVLYGEALKASIDVSTTRIEYVAGRTDIIIKFNDIILMIIELKVAPLTSNAVAQSVAELFALECQLNINDGIVPLNATERTRPIVVTCTLETAIVIQRDQELQKDNGKAVISILSRACNRAELIELLFNEMRSMAHFWAGISSKSTGTTGFGSPLPRKRDDGDDDGDDDDDDDEDDGRHKENKQVKRKGRRSPRVLNFEAAAPEASGGGSSGGGGATQLASSAVLHDVSVNCLVPAASIMAKLAKEKRERRTLFRAHRTKLKRLARGREARRAQRQQRQQQQHQQQHQQHQTWSKENGVASSFAQRQQSKNKENEISF